jgi:ribosomal protein S18 acetylase RimI-like enzyme
MFWKWIAFERTGVAMSTLKVRDACGEDYAEIAKLIAEQNQKPETQCIHSGEGYDAILQTILKWDQASEICFAIALQDGQLTGVVGSEFDEDLGRGWLWGPHISSQGREQLAPALLHHLRAMLPPAIRRLDFFAHKANEWAFRFYEEHGFHEPKVSHVYVAYPPAAADGAFEPCGPLALDQTRPFASLHDSLFPRTYYTGQDILDQIDDEHQVFTCSEDGELAGYVYAIVDESAEGYIEFLGVGEKWRQRGLGRRLLVSALGWLFDGKGVPQVGLTVADDQVNARSLYEQVGFRIKYTGLSARAEW